jgi:hypothetical protein
MTNKILSVFLMVSFAGFSPNLAAAAPAPAPAVASSGGSSVGVKRAKIVVKSAIYGFGGGLVVGLASQVFKKKTKNIFMFGSLGMYAGILLGVYIISTSKAPAPYEGPDTYEDFSRNEMQPSSLRKLSDNKDWMAPQAGRVQLNFVSLNF